MSQSGSIRFGTGGGGGSGIQTIAGDVGSITGSNVTIFADNISNGAGATVLFNNSGTVSTLILSDVLSNLSLGQGAGPNTTNSSNTTAVGVGAMGSVTAATQNTAFGNGAMASYTGGGLANGNNTAVGFFSLAALDTGSRNISIGTSSSSSYIGSESSNIIIGSDGVVSDNNTIRIGAQGNSLGQQNLAFIAGIVGVTVSNAVPVMINSSTGQLGVGTAALSKIAFSANASTQQNNQTGDGTIITVQFPNATQTGSEYNAATGVFTCAVADYYEFNACVGFLGLSVTSTDVDCWFDYNGTQQFRFANLPALSITDLSTAGLVTGTVLLPLSPGDTVRVKAQVKGSVKNVGILGQYNAPIEIYTYFSATN